MPSTLPTSGQISFADLNDDRSVVTTSQADLDSISPVYGLSRPHSMNEFYGVQRYDVYLMCSPFGTYYYVPFNGGANTFGATINGVCGEKVDTNMTNARVIALYGSITFFADISNDNCSCGGGGGGEEPS